MAALPPGSRPLRVADACASASHAGLGGFVRLLDEKQRFFRKRAFCEELHALFPWFPASASAQSFIATLDALLGPGHLPVHCAFKCDNSAAEAASWKGRSMARGLCHILWSVLLCQQANRVSVYIDHVPGIMNDTADALSREIDPATLGFEASEESSVDWISFPSTPELNLFPSASDFDGFLCPPGKRSA